MDRREGLAGTDAAVPEARDEADFNLNPVRVARQALRHDLVTLRLYMQICELGSLTRAAEAAHMAVSAASRRLCLFEEELGSLLFKRLPHGLEPTMAGLSALRYAESALRLADQLLLDLDEYRSGTRGRIRILASSSALVQSLAADLARFSRDHPDIKVDLEERPTIETLEALSRGQADLGVIINGLVAEGLEQYPYSKDRLAVVVYPSHPLAARRSVRFTELVDEDFVGLETNTAISRLLTERARQIGTILKVRVQVRTFEVMCQMIVQGLGIGILPEGALRSLANALGLRIITLDETWAEREIIICVPAARAPSAATARLLDALKL